LTLYRTMHIVYSYKLDVGKVMGLILLSWLFSVNTALIPVFDIFSEESFIQTDACTLFNFVSIRQAGWQYGLTMFIVWNMLFILLMIGVYVRLVLHVYGSSQKLAVMGNVSVGQKRLRDTVKSVLILTGKTDVIVFVECIMCDQSVVTYSYHGY